MLTGAGVGRTGGSGGTVGEGEERGEVRGEEEERMEGEEEMRDPLPTSRDDDEAWLDGLMPPPMFDLLLFLGDIYIYIYIYI